MRCPVRVQPLAWSRRRERPLLWKQETSGLGGPIITLFRAQPEHAICQSYPTSTAKNYQNSGDSKRPAKVRITIDEDSRNPKTDSQHHAQGAIHSPYIQKRLHVGSGVRRFIQNRRSVQLACPKMGQIDSPTKQRITAISSLHLPSAARRPRAWSWCGSIALAATSCTSRQRIFPAHVQSRRASAIRPHIC